METRRLRLQRVNRELSLIESTLAGVQFSGDREKARHDLVGMEVRAYQARRPTSMDLATKRGMLDEIFGYDMMPPEAAAAAPQAIADVASDSFASLRDWSNQMGRQFGDAWDAITTQAREIMSGITRQTLDQVRSGLQVIQSKLQEVNSELGRRVRSAFEHHDHGTRLDELINQGAELELESGSVIVYDAKKREFTRTGECMEDLKAGLVDKAKHGDRGHAHESLRYRKNYLSERISHVEGELNRLNEVVVAAALAGAGAIVGGLSAALTSVLAFIGTVEVVVMGLAAVFRWIANRTCAAWVEKVANFFKSVNDFVHGAVGSLWDTTIPDGLAAAVYNIYLSMGGDPVEGDAGRKATQDDRESSFLGNLGSVFGKKTRRGSSPSYEEANVDPETGEKRGAIRRAFGQLGSRRELSGSDLAGPENDTFRRNVKQRVVMILVGILLIKYIVKLGASILGAAEFSWSVTGKVGVKSVEVGKTVAAEVGVAARHAGEIGAELGALAPEIAGVARAGAGLAGAMARGQETRKKGSSFSRVLDFGDFKKDVNAARERKGRPPLEGSDLAAAYLSYKERMGADPSVRRG